MDIRIGVKHTPKELHLELPEDTDSDALRAEVDAALRDEDAVLWLTDRRGRQVAVPAEKISYVDIGTPDSDRRVGFGS